MVEPPDQKICDIMLVYCQEDHQMAVKFCDILRKFITLKDGRHPDIKMWQATATSEMRPVQSGFKSATSAMCPLQGVINTRTCPLQSGFNAGTCPNQGRLDRGTRPIQGVLPPRKCLIHGGLNPGTGHRKSGTCPTKCGTCQTKSGTCPTKSGTCPTKSGTCPTKSGTCPTKFGKCPTQSSHGETCPTQAIPRSAKYSLHATPRSTICSTDSIPMSAIRPKQMTPTPKPIVRACEIQDMILCACVTKTSTSCASQGKFCEECVSGRCDVCRSSTGNNPTKRKCLTSAFTESDSVDTSELETLAQCCSNGGPPAATLANHPINIERSSRAFCDGGCCNIADLSFNNKGETDAQLSCLNAGQASGDVGPALAQYFVNRLRHFQTELASSHFVFLFVNTRFMTDSWAQLQSEECVLQGM